MVRVAFDVAGAGPRAQLCRNALVEVLCDGIEILHLLLAVTHQFRNGGRARHALFASRFMRVLDRADGGHLRLQIGHKRRRQGVRRELRHPRGLGRLRVRVISRLHGQLDEIGVGRCQHLTRIIMLRRRKQIVKTRRILRDGAGGAGDVLQIGVQRHDQRILRRHLAALLRGPRRHQLLLVAAEIGVIRRALAPGGNIHEVGFPNPCPSVFIRG